MNQIEQAKIHPSTLNNNNDPYLQLVKRKWEDSQISGYVDTDAPASKFQNTSGLDEKENNNTNHKNEIEEDDEELKIKRKEQNRAAQRAFRERKERYVKDLEMKIKQVQENHVYSTNQLYQENQHLKSIIHRLEAENLALKGVVPLTMDPTATTATSFMFPFMGLPFQPSSPSLSPSTTSLPLNPTTNITSPSNNTNTNNNIKLKQYPKPIAAKPVPILPQQPIASTISESNEMTRPILLKDNFQQLQQQQQQQQQQQFTFSITTPDTLRANETEKSTSNHSPIELIPLYHPNHQYQMNSSSFNYPAPSSSSPSSSSSYSVVSPTTASSTSSVVTLSPKESLHNNANINNNNNNNDNNNNNIGDDEDKNQTMPSFLDGYDVFEHLLTQQDLFSDDKLVVSLIPSRRNSLQEQMEIAEQQEKNHDTLLLDNQEMIKILDKKENIVEKDGLFMDDDQSSSMKKDKNNHHHGIMDNIHSTHEALLPTSMITNRQHHHQNQQQQQQQQQVEQQQVEQQQRHQQRQQRQHRNRIRVDHDERSPIWEKVTEHAENNKFNIEHLLEAVKLTTTSKRENKSLVDEWELESMIQDLNYYL